MGIGLYKMLYLAGCSLRRTPVLYFVGQLKESQWWSLDQYRDYQLVKVRELLSHAQEYSPFYRDYFKERGFEPRIGSIDDLKRLPLLIKGRC